MASTPSTSIPIEIHNLFARFWNVRERWLAFEKDTCLYTWGRIFQLTPPEKEMQYRRNYEYVIRTLTQLCKTNYDAMNITLQYPTAENIARMKELLRYQEQLMTTATEIADSVKILFPSTKMPMLADITEQEEKELILEVEAMSIEPDELGDVTAESE